jgi:hypothetical protein
VTWERVIQALDRLRESGVGAVVAAVPPSRPAFDRIERVGRVWVAWLDAKPWAEAGSPQTRLEFSRQPGRARIVIDTPSSDRLVVRETWDPGWQARLDGRPLALTAERGIFLGLHVPPGHHELILEYEPEEVRIALAGSGLAMVLVILILTGIRRF